MADLVVTCPAYFWPEWIAEGDAAGAPETGEEWGFTIARPNLTASPIAVGERLYVVAHGRLRGYAPITRVEIIPGEHGSITFGRRGGAVAVTIPEAIRGFQGYRRRWWDPAVEVPFDDWKTAGVPAKLARRIR